MSKRAASSNPGSVGNGAAPGFSLPAIRSRDRAYFQFALGLSVFNGTTAIPAVRTLYRERAAEAERLTGRPADTSEEALKLVDGSFAYQFSRWCLYSWQCMFWGSLQAIERDPAVERQLWAERATLPAGPYGSIRIDPNFVMPAYYTSVNFHLTPGHYFGNHLIYIFQHYLQVKSVIPGNHKTIADRVEPAMPARPRRILDIGCGSGRSTLPLKRKWPDAEVYGVDVAANLVTNAHLIAQFEKLDVHFSQQAGEDLDFPDGSFDVVQLWTLQHELPPEAMRAVLCEAFRVCAPSGRVISADIAPLARMTPIDRALREWEVDNFEEPYLGVAGRSELPSLLREVGLKDVRELPPANLCDGGDYPWITFGDKASTPEASHAAGASHLADRGV